MQPDESLYQLIKAGDLSAFDILYDRYHRRLFRFIESFLNNHQESEDVLHEAFLKVLKLPPFESEQGSFQAWIYEISRNLCLNRLRSRSREKKAVDALPEPTAVHSSESLERVTPFRK
jgi:RNA polymerase sigma-70 factor (ECF subfamily)